MPRPPLRDNAIDALGATHAYKTGTAHSTAATVVAAQSTGLKIRIKAFRFIAAYDWSATAAADTALNAAWLSDGATTPLIALGQFPGLDTTTVIADANTLKLDTGMIILPGFGVSGTAATALTIDWTTTNGTLTYQLDVYYDVINATGDVQ